MITLDELNAGMIGRCGLKTEGEVRLLFEAVCMEGSHLEIGTLWGGSAVVAGMAKRAMGLGHVVTVDPMSGGWWDTGDPAVGRAPTPGDVLANLARFGVGEWVSVVRGRAAQVRLGKRYVTALVDGDHSFEGCLRDWELVRDLGVRLVLFHDYDEGHTGVMRVVDEVVGMDKEWRVWGIQGCLVGFWRG